MFEYQSIKLLLGIVTYLTCSIAAFQIAVIFFVIILYEFLPEDILFRCVQRYVISNRIDLGGPRSLSNCFVLYTYVYSNGKWSLKSILLSLRKIYKTVF